MKTFLVIAVLSIAFAGCTSVQPVDANTPAIVLKERQTRNLVGAGSVTVPAGVYEPDFETTTGIYYRAPTHMVIKALGISAVQRGGIFLPRPLSEEEKARVAEARRQRASVPPQGFNTGSSGVRSEKHGIWTDHQEASGGLLVYGATSPKNVRSVEQPFVFEYQKREISLDAISDTATK